MSRQQFGHALHSGHLWADVAIGAIAIFTLVLGEEIMGSVFWQADLTFHIVIFALAFGSIGAERLMHKSGHAFGGRLHRLHLITDAAIGALMLVLIFVGEEAITTTFAGADMAFHVIVFVLAIGGVAAERLMHRHNHEGVIGA
jgi:hypothetical protein